MTKSKNPKQKRNRRILISLSVIIVLLVLGWFTGIIGKEDKTKVETEAIQKRKITEKVSASGKLKPSKEIKLSADVSGEIVKLPVKEGDQVKKGDLLVKIKPDAYQAAVDRAEASLNQAKANLANTKAQLTEAKAQYKRLKQRFERNKRLFEKEAISESKFEQIKSEYETQKARIESTKQSIKGARFNVASAKANLSEAQDNLDKTSIYAPANGTVSLLNMEKGERVVGTMQMEGTEIMRIADLNVMEVEVDVNENDIIRIAHGDTAVIDVDAFINEKFKGVVTQIANSARSGSSESMGASSDQVTNFPVKIRILKSSYDHLIDTTQNITTPFRPGMSAIVEIMTQTRKDVTGVPILSVTTRKPEIQQSQSSTNNDPQEVVFLYKDGMALRKSVTTGIQDDYYIQIKDGVKKGQQVISGPYNVVSKILKDSMNVSIQTKSDQTASF